MKKNFAILISIVIPIFLLTVSCKEEAPAVNSIDVEFTLPSLMEVSSGGDYTFAVINGKAPLGTDQILFESVDNGISNICLIKNTSPGGFTITLAAGVVDGSYRVYIKRGTEKKSIGSTYVSIVSDISGFEPDASSTVYGQVSCDGSGVAGVVVSDGVEVTVTDENGIYEMNSAKKWGYVFISIPSGYEVPSVGILPQFHRYLRADAKVLERADFSLTKVSGQDSYKVFMLGDMHLAKRTGDLSQFQNFTDDLNSYMASHGGTKMYAITLGDMTWDLYWYSNNYAFSEYLETMNSSITGLQVFHTMGNHDNDYKTLSDFTAAAQYVKDIGPTYYSFNIGKVHFVVLDDIDCSSYDGTTSRNYSKGISTEQFTWLRKDLSHVDKSTPIVLTAHAQIFYPSGTGFKIDHNTSNTNELFEILNGYTVHFVTGHTHMTFNVTPDESITGGRNFYEHNSGSVCASWWWSGNLTPGVHVSLDGTPGGYAIWDISGTDMKWIYKSTGWDESYQFRSYDLNNVSFSMADVPNMPSNVSSSVLNAYKKYVDAYPGTQTNEVLINIWNWNSDWTLDVTDENGKKLTYSEVWAYDPLHIAALSVKRFNNSSLSSTPNFITSNFRHFFKVQTDSPDTDLTITVSDEFRHTWTENMQRPKEFNVSDFTAK